MHLSREYRRRAYTKRNERRGVALIIVCGIIVAFLVIYVGLYPKV